MSQQVVKRQNTRVARRLVWFAGFISVWALFMLCTLASNPGALAAVVIFVLLVDGAIFAYASSQGYWFEWQMERKWKKVCRGIGSNFVSERQRTIAKPTGVVYGPITQQHTERRYPKLRDVRGTRDSWTGVVVPFYGQNVDDFVKQADRFALAFNVASVGFDRTPNGVLRISAGRVTVPGRYSFGE